MSQKGKCGQSLGSQEDVCLPKTQHQAALMSQKFKGAELAERLAPGQQSIQQA